MATDTESNPYAVPSSASASTTIVDFAPILRRWERLRVLYNLILGTLVLTITFVWFPANAVDPAFWMSVAFGAAIANLCFMTGPAIEAYGTHFRVWNGVLTSLLFLVGLGFTALLAALSVATF